MNNLLTTQQVADRLGLSKRTVNLYVHQGKIRPVILGDTGKRRTMRFEASEVERFIGKCKKESLRKKVRRVFGI